MASTSNTEKRGRSTEENIARGVQSGNTSGGGNRSEKTSLVEYTKTIVRLLRSRCERSQMASAEDRVFEVSELVHDAAGQPDLGTVDADDRKKMYRRFYDVIKVLAACRIIFFPGVDNVSRATKFTIADNIDWDSLIPGDPMSLEEFIARSDEYARIADRHVEEVGFGSVQHMSYDTASLLCDDDDLPHPDAVLAAASPSAAAVAAVGGITSAPAVDVGDDIKFCGDQTDSDNEERIKVDWIKTQRLSFLCTYVANKQTSTCEEIQAMANMLKNMAGGSHGFSRGASGNQSVDGANLSILQTKIDELSEQAITLTREVQRLQELKNAMDQHLINAHIPLWLSNALDAVLMDHEDEDEDEDEEEFKAWLRGPPATENC